MMGRKREDADKMRVKDITHLWEPYSHLGMAGPLRLPLLPAGPWEKGAPGPSLCLEEQKKQSSSASAERQAGSIYK